MNDIENSQHLEDLKKMIAENEQMRKELKEAIEKIEDMLQSKTTHSDDRLDSSCH